MSEEVKKTGNKPFPTGKAGPGRPKGALNKTTAALKEAILSAAEKHGKDGQGEDGLLGYLYKVASEDTKAFSALLGRVLPYTVQGNPDAPVVHRIERRIVRVGD